MQAKDEMMRLNILNPNRVGGKTFTIDEVVLPIVNYLHTIVLSGYWKEEQWQLWADELILCNDELEGWIYDVAFAKNREELCMVIAHEKITEVFDKETLYWEPDVVIGYYYLMYKEGKMDLLELFSKLIDEDDVSSEAKLFNFQEASLILNKVRMDEMDIEKIDKLFKPLAKVAREQLEVLTHYMKM